MIDFSSAIEPRLRVHPAVAVAYESLIRAFHVSQCTEYTSIVLAYELGWARIPIFLEICSVPSQALCFLHLYIELSESFACYILIRRSEQRFADFLIGKLTMRTCYHLHHT